MLTSFEFEDNINKSHRLNEDDDSSNEEDLESPEGEDHTDLVEILPSVTGSQNRGANDSSALGCGLEDVINRYDALISGPQDESQSAENIFEYEAIATLAERAMQLSSEDDLGLWRVRVRDGTEEDSILLLRDRLKVRPQWAIAVFWTPEARRWICVQSDSRENVEKLCINLSTFPHPLEVIFVPVKERLDWLNPHHQAPRITHPAWVRIKSKSELTYLLSNGWNFDDRVMKHANDLAYVPWTDEAGASVCLVPRLPVPISNGDSVEGESKRQPKAKRRQRLLHPMLLGNPQEASRAMNATDMIDHSMWWHPRTRYELKKVGLILYQLAKPKSKTMFNGGDKFVPPFAFCGLPEIALQSESVVPTLGELRIFVEGFAIGSQQLHFPRPDADFLRWTYDNHIAARVEIGHKVEAKVNGGMIRGVIVDIVSNEVALWINNTEEIAVDVRCVRRFYEVGDAVKAMVEASHQNREGWVVGIREGEIEVFDRNAKEHFHVQSWQLIPYDSFERALPRHIQVGDTVRVISPISPDYGERGKVCNVNELGVDVMRDRPNTKFTVPHWFLEVEPCKDAPAPSADRLKQERRSLAHYDRYKELINTWVQVTGNHVEKGLYGRIRESLGEGILCIEDRAGTRLVNIHVDFLLNDRENKGRDLTGYYIGQYQTPATMGRRLPSLPIVQPVRATTPGADEPTWPEAPRRQQDGGTIPGTYVAVGNVNPPVTSPMTSHSAAAIHLPQLQRRLEGEISYENQVLPANWLMKGDLVTKRIWTHVHNTETDPFEQGGFARGRYEGQRVLVLSGEREGEIVVNARQQSVKIPAKYLFPERPTSKGQDVVVISGDNLGEVYFTRKPKKEGFFPLGRRGYSGPSLCIIEASRLARCDPLSKS